MNADADAPELFPDFDLAGALRAAFRQPERAGAGAARAGAHSVAESAGKACGYELAGEIARGGMGVIVKAYDRELGREVALKVLRDDVAQQPTLVRRFLEEARVTARLDHPGIVPVHEVGFDAQGRAFFAMRLVRGRDLRTIIELAQAEQEGWNLTRALSAMLKVCEAMAYAHDKGVIHRDLKPSNVMVGEFGEVYVMDWGLARVLGREDAHDLRLRTQPDADSSTQPDAGSVVRHERARTPARTSERAARTQSADADVDSPIVTMDGEVLGTPCYMAPEQALGRIDELGPRSDVYSTGALLYHLLAGELPYVPAGTSVASRTVLLRLVEGPPRALQELRPELAPELVAICEKAMARDPAQRYADMLAMAQDLRAYLERRVVGAYETGAWAQARKWIVRNKPLAGALAGVVLALVVGLVVSLQLKARSDDNARRAENNARSAQDERDRALKIASFLEDTLAGVETSVALGRDTALLRDLMDAAWLRIERGELASAPHAELRLMLVIGQAYNDIARYDKGEPILRLALTKARDLFAGDHELTATALGAIGFACRYQSKLSEAESLTRASLEMRRRLVQGDDSYVAACLENLASVQQSQGDMAAAEAGLRESLAMLTRLHPGDHRELTLNMHNLAVVLAARGDAAGAQKLYRDAIAMHERLQSGDRPEVAASLDSLGASLQQHGDLDAAEPLLRRALEMRRRLYATDHPDLANSVNNLGTLLYQRGDEKGAEALLREALEMQQRLFKGDHAIVAQSLINVAALTQGRGDLAGAEPLLRDALAMQKRLFQGDHPSIPSGLHTLAMLLTARSELTEALRLEREALDMQRRLTPGDQPENAILLGGVAAVLRARGELGEAIALQREALEMRQRLFHGDHIDVATSTGTLGRLLEQNGDLEAAQPVLRETLRILRALLPATDGRIANTGLQLGRVQGKLHQFDAADETLRTAYGGMAAPTDGRADARIECLQLIVANLAAWEESEPGQGHSDSGPEWRHKLDELQKK